MLVVIATAYDLFDSWTEQYGLGKISSNNQSLQSHGEFPHMLKLRSVRSLDVAKWRIGFHNAV